MRVWAGLLKVCMLPRRPFRRDCAGRSEKAGDGSEQEDEDDGDFAEDTWRLGFEPFVFGAGGGCLGFGWRGCVRWDGLFEVLEGIRGREASVAAAGAEGAQGAEEETVLAVEVFFEDIEIAAAGAVGEGGFHSEVDFAVFFDVVMALFSDGEIEFRGLGGFEAPDFPAGVDHVFDEVGFERIAGGKEAVVEGGELVEDVLGLVFEDDAGGVHAVLGVIERGPGFARGGDGAVGAGSVDFGLFRACAFLSRHICSYFRRAGED